MTSYLHMMRTCPVTALESYFQQLGTLASIVRVSIKSFLVDIFALIKEFWSPSSQLQVTILQLIEAIALALEGEIFHCSRILKFSFYFLLTKASLKHIFQ